MKSIFQLLISVSLFCGSLICGSSMALATPGWSRLTCYSSVNSGSKQKLVLSVQRYNAAGLTSPEIKVSVDGKIYKLDTPDDMNLYGETVHNSPLGVIRITADNWRTEHGTLGFFSVTGIPSTVKAYTTDGKPVQWSLDAEKQECYDENGKATLKGIFRGMLELVPKERRPEMIPLDVQVMDCELEYNSGSAC